MEEWRRRHEARGSTFLRRPCIHPSTLHIDRLLALQEKVVARLKTIWSLAAAGIALLAAMLKDWLLGSK